MEQNKALEVLIQVAQLASVGLILTNFKRVEFTNAV